MGLTTPLHNLRHKLLQARFGWIQHFKSAPHLSINSLDAPAGCSHFPTVDELILKMPERSSLERKKAVHRSL
ncbi:MAG: hypothetical protein ACTFAL_02840 [Candidatus Electronema sp. V4]|uniref:hypothetical protein n=1 Tax=Candidatus Electronema sp. V4 TaxID=3454756 RepID=UPI0040558E77